MLDPFPYSSGTTGREALWMGVPLVFLNRELDERGCILDHILTQAGLENFVTKDKQGYMDIVTYYAAHIDELSEIRTNMRERLKNVDAFKKQKDGAVHLEQLYQLMWQRRCDDLPADHISSDGEAL